MVKVTDVETFWSPELPLTAIVKVWLGVSVLVMGWWLLPVPPQETRLHVIKASTSSQAIRPTTFLVLPPPATAMAIPIIFFSGRRRHTSWTGDWSSDVCSSD